MTPSDYSDDECIAYAMIHGAEFYHRPEHAEQNQTTWTCSHPSEDHPEYTWEDCDGATQGAAARRYCIRFNLI
jgi:hypothetical protein